MTFQEAQNFLLSLSNIPRLEYIKDARKCGVYLKRLQFFLDILGNPEKKIPHYVHITGTSGKGSTANFIASILTASGKKTGITTSPHMSSITDRWHIDGKQISKKEFIKLVEKIKKALAIYVRKSKHDMVSYHEITTAIGLLYYAEKRVEWAVIEVGAGGRYDSTNVIPRKDIAIITNIGVDHTGYLGSTKAEIAYEKSGIIKKGCHVLTMERDKKILAILEREANLKKVDFQKADNRKQITELGIGGTSFIYKKNQYHIQSLGRHQIDNAILAISTAQALAINEKSIKSGLKKTKQPLRMEIILKNPTIILDGAHNLDKIKSTVETVKQITETTNKQTSLIVGFSNDKKLKLILKQLAKLKPKSIAITRNTVNPFRKVAPPNLIKKEFKKLLPRTKMEVFIDPQEALSWSKRQTKKSDIILVTGSIFLSGELR